MSGDEIRRRGRQLSGDYTELAREVAGTVSIVSVEVVSQTRHGIGLLHRSFVEQIVPQ